MKKYIKLFTLFLTVSILMVMGGCSVADKSDPRVSDAIELISESWNEYYENSSLDIEDKYLEITNTKIINIKPNNGIAFEDVEYIVEFSLESNFFDSAPYYVNIGARNSFVVVYKDGKKEVELNNPILVFIQRNGSTDVPDIIESVEYFHSEYDQVLKIG